MKRLERWWLGCCVRIPILSDVHYVFSGEFRREHRAVLAGKLRFMQTLQADSKSTEYTLRRNVHRLEKGLIMKPRRPVFAADYIGETVDFFRVLKQGQGSGASPPTPSPSTARDQTQVSVLEWAESVLGRYFDVVDKTPPPIARAWEQFQQAIGLTPTSLPYAPYVARDLDHGISPDQFLKLCLQRRSVRWYDDRPVPRDLLEQAVRMASLSPSACNRQPFRFVVADDPAQAQRLGEIPMGTVGFSNQFPALIIVVGDLSAYFSERDRHLIYVDGGLASMSLVLALETLGLSSCCINWPDIEDREVKLGQALGLSLHERAVMCISVGFKRTDGEVPFSQKKSVAELSQFLTKATDDKVD